MNEVAGPESSSRAGGGGDRLQPLWPWVLLGITLLVYGRALGTYFAQDDFRWLWEAAHGEPASTFTPRYLSQVLYFRVLWNWFGFTPWLFHAFGLGLHLATGSILYHLLKTRLPARWAAGAAALFLSSPAVFTALHWVSASGDLLCGLFLALTVGLLATRSTSASWPPWAALASYALALSSKEIAVGAAPLLALLAWRRGSRLAWLHVAGLVALGAAAGVVAARLGPNAYSIKPEAALMNLPGYVAAALAGGLAARVASDLEWARSTPVLIGGGLALLAWILWLSRSRAPLGWFGFLWFLGVLSPVLVLERQFYFYYLYCALPGLWVSLAALSASAAVPLARGLPALAAALVVAQGVAIEVRVASRLKLAPLPSDFVLRRAMTARNTLADLEASAPALRPRLILIGQQPLQVSSQGMKTTSRITYTPDPFLDDNVKVAVAGGYAIRLRHPEVESVKFVRWIEAGDSASTIVPFQFDGHLRAMDYSIYVGRNASGPGARLEDRMARVGFLIERRMFFEARQELEAANRLAPDHPDVLLNLGAVAFRMGDTTAAIRALTRAVEVSSGDLEALFNLGLVHWRSGKREEAGRVWARLESLAPESDLARLARNMMSGKAR